MFLKILLIVTLSCSATLAYDDYRCNKKSALLLLKQPAYEFSIKLLQRVTENTDAHFVFSPISTWMQLTALAEGASDKTLREIWRVTKHHRNRCFRRKIRDILFQMQIDLKQENKRKSIIAMDYLMAIKKSYIQQVEKLYGIKVLLLDFNQDKKSAEEVNSIVGNSTGGMIDQIVYYDDFISTLMLLSDANYFRSAWRTPFNHGYTNTQQFYSSSGVKIGEVNMMNQKGYFHYLDFTFLGAKVLELPFSNRRISMLVFLPSNNTVRELFYSLERTRLTSIFNFFKRDGVKLVNVSLPKFKQRTEVDNLPELIFDMGVKRIFDPDKAEFNRISKYKMYASLMTQISFIDVNEEGVTAGVEFLAFNDTSIDFTANKPFAYVIVDKITEFILYAGMYSMPGVF